MIRNMGLQDIEAVLNIWLEASIQAHGFIDASFWHSQLDAMRHVYLPAADSHIFEREGKVCGFCSLNQNVLAALFVAPEHQGTGIVRTVTRRCKDPPSDVGTSRVLSQYPRTSLLRTTGLRCAVRTAGRTHWEFGNTHAMGSVIKLPVPCTT